MKPPLLRRREFGILLLATTPLLSCAICYGAEFVSVAMFLYEQVRSILAMPLGEAGIKPLNSLQVLGYEVVVVIVMFISSLGLVSQFVLPAQTMLERRRVFGRLWLYVTHQHGQAIYIKNGKVVATQEERRKIDKPGVAFVDSASALVLEKETPPKKAILAKREHARHKLMLFLYQSEKRLWRQRSVLLASLLWWIRWIRIMPQRIIYRALIRLRLRKERRLPKPPVATRAEGPGVVFTEPGEIVRDTLDLRRQSRSRKNIKGLTRDGIEVTTTINVTFALDEQPDSPTQGEQRASGEHRSRLAYPFNRESAFRAVYGTPIAKKTGEEADDEEEAKHWTDLPALVASDIFRDMISTETLDNLFRPNSDTDFPLEKLRNDFSERVKHEKVLKERGISIRSAGFGKLTLPELVMKQRTKSWQAQWQRVARETLAAGKLQAERIKQRSREDAQHDMIQQMAEILCKGHGSRAAIVWRLFQALETASADPAVRGLLPSDTVAMLNSWLEAFRGWLGDSS